MSKKNRNYNNPNNQPTTNFADIMGAVDDTVRSLKAPVPVQQMAEPEVDDYEENIQEQEEPSVPDNSTVTSDASGTTVAKPVVPTQPVVSTPETTEASIAEVNQMNLLISKYLEFNNGTIMRSEKDKQTAGSMFRDILFYAIDHPIKEVLDCVYRFFKNNKDKVLAPQIALPQTLHFNRDITERIHCIYTLFRGLTGEKQFRLNIATTRSMLRSVDNKKIDALLMYFDVKSKQ